MQLNRVPLLLGETQYYAVEQSAPAFGGDPKVGWQCPNSVPRVFLRSFLAFLKIG